MKPLHYTASALVLGLTLMGNAQAVTTIPFWHSMEGELGKEVNSLVQRFNAENPDYKIIPSGVLRRQSDLNVELQIPLGITEALFAARLFLNGHQFHDVLFR
ncbi:hypothetical protein LAW48_23490, partial [Escherichia coli]|nr:hypothetical protein [Escherichia coli]